MTDNILKFPRERKPVETFSDEPSAQQRAAEVVTLPTSRQKILRASTEQIIDDIMSLARRADEAGMQSAAANLIRTVFIVVDDSPDPDDDGGGASLQASAPHRNRQR